MNKNNDDCYCNIWETDPDHFKEKGIPKGYCGFCEKCGAPGHTRHFPAPVPYTGSWCDKHYKILKYTWLLHIPMFYIFIAVALIIIYLKYF